MKRLLPLVLIFLFGCISCRRSADDSAVQKAALTYYNYLIEGQYEQYVNGIAYSDSMTSAYKNQMMDLMAQYINREKQSRGGLTSVRVLGDTVMGDAACVFLELMYGDSTREEVSLPMFRCGEEWKMQ